LCLIDLHPHFSQNLLILSVIWNAAFPQLVFYYQQLPVLYSNQHGSISPHSFYRRFLVSKPPPCIRALLLALF
jgi:hypothetical protein